MAADTASRIKKHIIQLLLVLLLSFGLLLTLLKALNLQDSIPTALLVSFLFAAVLEAAVWNKKTAFAATGILATALVAWLLAGGSSFLVNLFRAFTLHVTGVPGALPLMSREASLFLSAAVTLICFLSGREEAGSLPSLILCVSSLLIIWLSNRPELTVYLLPALVSALVLLLLDRHRELSPLRVIPWAAVMILAAWLITPSAGIVYPPLKEKADELRQAIMDRLFFTEPRDVFSLASEGFYHEGVSQLGGPVTLSDHPVMQVSAPSTVYLRGVVFNQYDGRSWRNTLGGRRYLWDSRASQSRRAVLFDENLPDQSWDSSLLLEHDISVRMLTDSASTLFVPQRIRELRAGGDQVPYFSNSSEVFITRNLREGDTWAVSAPLLKAGDPGVGILIDAASVEEDPQWNSVQETYTALPAHLEEPVWQLALDTVSGLSSAYDRAFALQNMLRRNYRYTLDVEEHSPELDFVTHFLFNTKQGYCTYFASAMTVLCRMAGLPARYVEGYVGEPNAQGEAYITGENAHAWTEVYFRGFGWLTFDPTPVGHHQNSDSNGGEGDSGSTPSPSPTPTPTPAPEETESSTPEYSPPADSEGSESSGDENNDPTPSPTPTPTPDPSSSDSDNDPDEDNDENSEPPDRSDENPPPENSSSESSEPDQQGGSFPGTLLWILIILILVLLVVLRWIFTSPQRLEKKAADNSTKFDIWLQETVDCLFVLRQVRGKGETPISYTRRLDASGTVPVSMAELGERVSLLRYGKIEPLPADVALVRNTALGLKRGFSFPEHLRYAIRRLMLPKKRKPSF